ncbi:ABC transporter ATP-binding protein [Terrimonas pollutisoli]|uniref:ABC transporter ATP-binding protein n=1 Tax=Terrimonas pollutisoli TaxID=3034147 RepID=UPI0023EC9FC5|nr:ABC transporter ATP-binding protein [Terrimonas sp. H1YJ31]
MKIPDLSILKKVLLRAKPYWLNIVAIFVLNLAAVPIALLAPIPLKIIVDNAFGKQPMPGIITFFFPQHFDFSFSAIILTATILMILIELLGQLQGLLSWLIQSYTGEKLVLSLRTLLFNHVQRLSLSYHDKTGVSDSLYRIQNDATAIKNLVVSGLSPIITSLLTLIGMLYVMTTLDWHFTLIAVCAIPPLMLLARFSRTKLKNQWQEVKRSESAAMSVIHETLSALRVVKAFVREDYEEQRFVNRSNDALKNQIKVVRYSGIFDVGIGLVLATGTALFLYFGSMYVHQGKITLGELILIMAYLAQFFSPLRTITKQYTNLQSAFVGLERVYSLIDKEKDVEEHPNARKTNKINGSIKFENVSFEYNKGTPVLQDISFEIKPGQQVGIMGSTGSGKTTLVNLLARFYEPTRGRIVVDGTDIREYKVADFRSQFSIVLQEPVLFSTSIEENIAYGKPTASKKEIHAAAKDAHAHEFISHFPNGYQSKVGERGMQLSGGERQRISIARAFLKNSPLLILDEPTSSVDIRTESLIMNATRKLMDGKTTFFITHRLDALAHCDLVIHLEKGKIVDIIYNDHPEWLNTKINSFREKAI